MNQQLVKAWIGGARLGDLFGWGWGATWPFAKLIVSEKGITLTVLMAKYVFDSNQITSIEPLNWIPFLATGIKIKHNVVDYPKGIAFWILAANSECLLREIKSLGYEQCKVAS